jgi:Fic family protein
MKSGDNPYVWQRQDWPQWRYQAESLMPLLAQVHQSLGHLMGRMRDQGMPSQDHANLEALTTDVLKTSEIEGEQFDAATVRSSIARRLGVDVGALMPADRHVDGVVEMILDATSLHATIQSSLFSFALDVPPLARRHTSRSWSLSRCERRKNSAPSAPASCSSESESSIVSSHV